MNIKFEPMQSDYEECVLCHQTTSTYKDTHIDLRDNYVEGVGQLCDECYEKIVEKQKSNEINEKYFKHEIEKYKNSINYKPKPFYELVKRIIDIVFCIFAFVPVLIIVVIFSIIIILDSPGSPIFSQVRVGKNGKFITIHKLRSMRIDAEANGQKWAEKDDPRVTRVGRFIRKYRIDELPQVFDILSGNISLIGPRPEIPLFTYKFNMETPGFVTRLLVTPGISGWAQVNGGYELKPNEKWKYDNEYIEKRDIKMYLRIFILTIKTVFCGEGAR